MKFSWISAKRLRLSLLCGLLFTLTLSMVRFDSDCEELRRNVLRLHIIANSDSAPDQQVKLAVRDAILQTSSDLFEGEATLDAAEMTVLQNLDRISAAANSVLEKQGFGYTAAVTVEDSFFETREYEDFTLPAGTYRSLMVRLGKAGGKNWWCVVFPALCVPAASKAQLRDAVSDEAATVANNPNRYQMRFKIVEIIENLKKFLRDE